MPFARVGNYTGEDGGSHGLNKVFMPWLMLVRFPKAGLSSLEYNRVCNIKNPVQAELF